ncbi:hypothetical protein [Halocatena marina]|uniref:hypothetical protein n=1 Tax=Halocatena marina TaxID=2934937 RepID=UPI0036F1964A
MFLQIIHVLIPNVLCDSLLGLTGVWITNLKAIIVRLCDTLYPVVIIIQRTDSSHMVVMEMGYEEMKRYSITILL